MKAAGAFKWRAARELRDTMQSDIWSKNKGCQHPWDPIVRCAPPLFRPRKSISEKDSDPTLQGHPAAWRTGGLHEKSAFAQPFNLIETGADSPAECDITQTSQMAK